MMRANERARRAALVFGSCGLLVALAPCSSEAPAANAHSSGGEAPRAAKPRAVVRRVPPKGEEPDRRVHMQATFWMAIIARDALIDGDLNAARSVGHELAAHDYGDAFPPSWKHWVGEMQKQAGALAIAADDAEAGHALGALALACGNCHRDHEGGLRLPDSEAMPWYDPPETIAGRMERHAVGIEQMWFGLIAPSEDAWRAGTITITRAPLDPPRAGDEPVDETMHAQFERLRAFAQQARTAAAPADRARLYGEAITTCAQCHYTTTYIDP